MQKSVPEDLQKVLRSTILRVSAPKQINMIKRQKLAMKFDERNFMNNKSYIAISGSGVASIKSSSLHVVLLGQKI